MSPSTKVLLVGVACLLVGFTAGRLSGRPGHRSVEDATAETLRAVAEAPTAARARAHRGESRDAGVAAPMFPTALDVDAGTAPCVPVGERAARAATGLDNIVLRVRERDGSVPPESAANAVSQYVEGWLSALMAGSPDELRGTAQEVAERMCTPGLRNAQALVYTRIALLAGELAPEFRRGLECVLVAHPDEDVITWTAMDAWRNAGYGPSEGLDDLRARATDRRTRRRFDEWDQPIHPPESE